MAGTDNTACAQCGENWYDQSDRVGDVCPLCWEINQARVSAAEAQAKAEALEEHLRVRQAEQRELQQERKDAADVSARVSTRATSRTAASV